MRRVLRASVLICAALAVAPRASAQTPVSADARDDVTETVSVPVFPGQIVSATLTLPALDEAPYPAVLVLTVQAPGGAPIPAAAVLARALLDAGIAVVQLEVPPLAAGAEPAGEPLHQPADDAFAVLQFVREREDVDGDRVGVVGLGAAAAWAARAAALDEAARALVLLGAAPVDSDTLGLPTTLPLLSLPADVRAAPARDGDAPTPIDDAAAFLARHLE